MVEAETMHFCSRSWRQGLPFQFSDFAFEWGFLFFRSSKKKSAEFPTSLLHALHENHADLIATLASHFRKFENTCPDKKSSLSEVFKIMDGHGMTVQHGSAGACCNCLALAVRNVRGSHCSKDMDSGCMMGSFACEWRLCSKGKIFAEGSNSMPVCRGRLMCIICLIESVLVLSDDRVMCSQCIVSTMEARGWNTRQVAQPSRLGKAYAFIAYMHENNLLLPLFRMGAMYLWMDVLLKGIHGTNSRTPPEVVQQLTVPQSPLNRYLCAFRSMAGLRKEEWNCNVLLECIASGVAPEWPLPGRDLIPSDVRYMMGFLRLDLCMTKGGPLRVSFKSMGLDTCTCKGPVCRGLGHMLVVGDAGIVEGFFKGQSPSANPASKLVQLMRKLPLEAFSADYLSSDCFSHAVRRLFIETQLPYPLVQDFLDSEHRRARVGGTKKYAERSKGPPVIQSIVGDSLEDGAHNDAVWGEEDDNGGGGGRGAGPSMLPGIIAGASSGGVYNAAWGSEGSAWVFPENMFTSPPPMPTLLLDNTRMSFPPHSPPRVPGRDGGCEPMKKKTRTSASGLLPMFVKTSTSNMEETSCTAFRGREDSFRDYIPASEDGNYPGCFKVMGMARDGGDPDSGTLKHSYDVHGGNGSVWGAVEGLCSNSIDTSMHVTIPDADCVIYNLFQRCNSLDDSFYEQPPDLLTPNEEGDQQQMEDADEPCTEGFSSSEEGGHQQQMEDADEPCTEGFSSSEEGGHQQQMEDADEPCAQGSANKESRTPAGDKKTEGDEALPRVSSSDQFVFSYQDDENYLSDF